MGSGRALAGGADMEVPRAFQQALHSPLESSMDSIALSIRSIARSVELQEEVVVRGVESVEGVERFVNAPCPTAGLAVLDIAARRRRLVDRLVEARGQCFVVGAVGGRGDLELAEQGPIALGELDDHRDESFVRLIREVGADARERVDAYRLGAAIALVRGSAPSPPCVCRSRSRRRRDSRTRL